MELSKAVPPDALATIRKRAKKKLKQQQRAGNDTVYAVLDHTARAVTAQADTPPPSPLPSPLPSRTNTPPSPVPQRTVRMSPSRPSAGPSANVQYERDKLDDFIGDAIRAFAKPKPGGFMNAILRQRKGDFGTPAATQEFVDKLTGEAIGKSATALWSAEQAAASGDTQKAFQAVIAHATSSATRALDTLPPKEQQKLLHHLKDFEKVNEAVNRDLHRDWMGASDVRKAVMDRLDVFMWAHGRGGEH